MPLSGTGTYTPPASTWNPAVDTTDINSTDWNALLSDLSTALSTCLFIDGQGTPTANIPMGGFKITGLAAGTAAADAVRFDQLAVAASTWIAAGGTADAITAAYSPAVTSLTDGLLLGFRATAANATTTPTFSPNGLTARTITKKGGSALIAGDIPGNLAESLLRFNLANTRWELLNPASDATVVAATQAEQEAASSTSVFVSPGRQQFHPSAAKVWCLATISGTITTSYNMTSVTDVGTGQITFTIATDFSSGNWIGFIQGRLLPGGTAGTNQVYYNTGGAAAGSVLGRAIELSGFAVADPTDWMFLGFGDQ